MKLPKLEKEEINKTVTDNKTGCTEDKKNKQKRSQVGNKSNNQAKAAKQKQKSEASNKQKGSDAEKAKEPKKARFETQKTKYQKLINEYDAAYDVFENLGQELYYEKLRANDLLCHIEYLVNSVSNTPKSLHEDIKEIIAQRESFNQAEEYARQEFDAARKAGVGAAAGVVAGAGIFKCASPLMMWVATTYGTASTGVAISSLSGAAATSAATAWLGGGALAAGGGGIAGGGALMALSGPVGAAVAGAGLVAFGGMFLHSKFKSREELQDQILVVMKATNELKKQTVIVSELGKKINKTRDSLNRNYNKDIKFYMSDFNELDESSRLELAALVNNAKTLSCLIAPLQSDES